MMSKGKELKGMINDKKILVLPGVYDGISARVVSRMGYKAGFITGSGLSESLLGEPDVGIMGLKENVDACRNISQSSNLLLIADGDTGYGNAVNAHYTYKAFQDTGVAGLMIEDQVWPKRCGHLAGKETISAEEMAGKIKAAVGAKKDPDFVVVARTDAAGTIGIDEAIRRANLYAESGADLLFADALLSVQDIERFTKSVQAPVMVNMGFGIRRRSTTPLVSPLELQNIGVAVVIYPRMLTAAAMQGMMNALTTLQEMERSGDAIERPEQLISFDELNEIMGLPQILNLETKYLTEEQLNKKYSGKK